ncbi:hypothetical protein RB195_013963 [Necator americanus]
MTTLCVRHTYACTEVAIEDLIMHTRKIGVNGLTQTRHRHRPDSVYDTGEALFLKTCKSRGVDEVHVFVNKSMMTIASVEQLKTRIGRLRMRRSKRQIGR